MNEEAVKEYVYSKYKQFKNKTITIVERDSTLEITSGKDESPLILSKNILN
jgi:hypothetical protein